jgi:hypothetical protein
MDIISDSTFGGGGIRIQDMKGKSFNFKIYLLDNGE